MDPCLSLPQYHFVFLLLFINPRILIYHMGDHTCHTVPTHSVYPYHYEPSYTNLMCGHAGFNEGNALIAADPPHPMGLQRVVMMLLAGMASL